MNGSYQRSAWSALVVWFVGAVVKAFLGGAVVVLTFLSPGVGMACCSYTDGCRLVPKSEVLGKPRECEGDASWCHQLPRANAPITGGLPLFCWVTEGSHVFVIKTQERPAGGLL